MSKSIEKFDFSTIHLIFPLAKIDNFNYHTTYHITEGGEKMATSFLLRDIPDSLHALIKSQAALEQVTMRTLFLKAVCQYLGMPYDEEKKGGN